MKFSCLTTERLRESRSRMKFGKKHHTVTSKPRVLSCFVGSVCPWASVSRLKATFLSLEMRLFFIARPRDLSEWHQSSLLRGCRRKILKKWKLLKRGLVPSFSLINFRTEMRILAYIYTNTFNFVREYKRYYGLSPHCSDIYPLYWSFTAIAYVKYEHDCTFLLTYWAS